MKNLAEYINESLVNEVSVELATRAYKKATGAQKNRRCKWYYRYASIVP